MVREALEKRTRTKSDASIVILTFACLALRAVIPAGYMPGNALAGEFMVLCPVGLPEAVARQLHDGHAAHDAQLLDLDAECSIGSGLQQAALPTAASAPDLVAGVSPASVQKPVSAIPGPRPRHFLIRGPPAA